MKFKEYPLDMSGRKYSITLTTEELIGLIEDVKDNESAGYGTYAALMEAIPDEVYEELYPAILHSDRYGCSREI